MNSLVNLSEKYPIERSRLLDIFDFSKYTADEMLLLDVYLSKINPRDVSTKRIQFRKKEYELFLEKKRQQAKIFKDTAVGLYYKPFDPTYLPEDIGFRPKNIWKDCCFEKDEETHEWVFTMECSKEAEPFFFDTQKYGFIRYLVGYTKRFTSKHSFILYYYLKRKRQEELRYGNPIKPTIAELKKLTATGSKKTYKEFKYFKRDVIDKALGEINSFTDIDVTCETVKTGRAIERVLFTVVEKATPPLLCESNAESSEELKELFAAELETMEEPSTLVLETPKTDYKHNVAEPTEGEYWNPESETTFADNPLKKRFSNSDDRECYIFNYINAVADNELEQILFQEVPEEVHAYELPKIKAIVDTLDSYHFFNITDYYEPDDADRMGSFKRARERMESERTREYRSAIRKINIQAYNIQKERIETNPYSYYIGILNKWFKNNQ